MNHSSSLPCTGRITLVGAGPGDPELLTLKAVKAIQRASVILVDDLVSDAILAHAGPHARITYVGKRGGCKSTPQARIEQLMLEAVRAGENVVRLKGGDPFIFGRGGEEVESLRAAGIEPEVVNGITAGLAAPRARPRRRLRHRSPAEGRARRRLGRAVGLGPRPAPDAGDLHGHQQRAAHPGRAAARPVGRHAGRRDRTRQPARAAPVPDHLVHDLRHSGLGSPAIVVVGNVVLGVRAALREAATAAA